MKRQKFSSNNMLSALALAAALTEATLAQTASATPPLANGAVFVPVTTNADAGAGSLRAAIQAINANGTAGGIVTFAIGSGCGPHVISLTTPLPDITQETHILGYSQPGASVNDLDVGNDANICIILDGSANNVSDAITVPASAASAVTISVIGLAFSGFSHSAINLRGGSDHVVTGIHIGGQASGVNLDPVGYGVILAPGVHGVTIGGDYTNYGLRNIIGEALNDAIHIDGTGASAGPAHDNTIEDNYLGIGYSGSQTSINRGNGNNGIYVAGFGNDIQRNYINFNGTNGIRFTGPDSHDNDTEDNFIGYQSDRTDAGNAIGVLIDSGSHDNIIDFNSIWYNAGAGVEIDDDSAHNSLYGNQFVANGGLGIDLGGDGVTPESNDSMGSGLPNRDQNFPVLTYAAGGHYGGTVKGSLTSTPGTYSIEAYESLGCDASGYGQGEFYVGNMQITIPNITVQGQGSVSFELPVGVNAPFGYTTITAIAIDNVGDTSEFSQCMTYTDDTIFADGFEPTE
jgi:trimeric autotransporter adhesin